MIIKSLGKLSVSGGIISGAVLVDTATQNIPKDIQKKISTEATEIKTVEDIELFEKVNNCRFVFVKGWESKELYGAREFLKEEKENSDAKNKVLTGRHWRMAKDWCKDKKGTVTLFYGQDTQEFAMTPPPGGDW